MDVPFGNTHVQSALRDTSVPIRFHNKEEWWFSLRFVGATTHFLLVCATLNMFKANRGTFLFEPYHFNVPGNGVGHEMPSSELLQNEGQFLQHGAQNQ